MGHTAVARTASGRAAVQRMGAMTPEHGWHMVPAEAQESMQAAVRPGTYRSAPTLAQRTAPALQLGPLERFARDGTVTDVDRNTALAQRERIVALAHVRAADVEPGAVQHLCQRRHGHAADTDQQPGFSWNQIILKIH